MAIKVNETAELLKKVTAPLTNPTEKQQNYFTQLIKDNPQNKVAQDIIGKVKSQWPSNFSDILPTPSEEINNLPKEAYNALTKRLDSYKSGDGDCPPPASKTSGTGVISADPCKNNFFAKTENELNNFFGKITNVSDVTLDLPNEIKSVSKMLSGTAKTYIGQMGNTLQDGVSNYIKEGLNAIDVRITNQYPNPAAALPRIIAEQKKTIAPSIKAFSAMNCLTAKVSNAMEDAIEDMLTSMSQNVINAPTCATQQMVGAITNKITDNMDSLISPTLDSLAGPFGKAFKVKDFLMGGIDTGKKIQDLVSCGDAPKCPSSSKYTIDGGEKKPRGESEQKGLMDKAIGAASVASSALDSIRKTTSETIPTALTEFEQEYGQWSIFGSKVNEAADHGIGNDCYTGNLFKCGAPKIEIFGGDGIGGAGKALLGNFIDKLDTDDIYGSIKSTASIIGVEITDRGSQYTEEPLISFTDNCNQGYGAFGKALIDKNPQSPTYGQITNIVILSEGENYPIDTEAEIREVYISEIIVENPGNNYDGAVIDDECLELNVTDGKITSVDIKCQKPYTDLPIIDILTSAGVGAILRPIMSTTKKQVVEAVIQSVDCVGDYPQPGGN